MMKKILLFMLVFIITAASASALGITPYKEEVFFSENVEYDLSFRVLNRESKDMKLGIFVRGDIAEYIELEKTTIELSKDQAEAYVKYKLMLPRKMEPGDATGEIVVIEMNDLDGKDMILTNLGAAHKIIVKVPYPGKYLQGILHITDAKPGEKVFFTVTLANLGTEELDVEGNIFISSNNKGITSLDTEKKKLLSGERGKIVQEWAADADPGTYHAYVTIEYGSNLLVLEDDFDIGDPLLDIEEVRSSSFKLGTIAKLDMIVNNMWNNEVIFDAYSEVYDSDANKIGGHESRGLSINPYARLSVPMYWDTEGISPGTYSLKTIVSYLGRTKEKEFIMDVSDDKIIISGDGITGRAISEGQGRGMGTYALAGASLLIVLLSMIFLRMRTRPKKPAIRESMDIKERIRMNLKQGISIKSIKEYLISKGYSESEAEKLILEAEDGLR